MDTSTVQQLNEINKKFYKTTAQAFSDSRKYYWQGWREFLPYLENLLGEKEKISVLDVGCGNGRFGNFLVDYLPSIEINYTGIDNSKELLEIAERQLKQTNLNIQLIETDIVETLLSGTFLHDLPQQFDVIVLFGVLHHIPTYKLRERLIAELSEKLTDNGLLVFTLWRFLDNDRLQKKQVNYAKASLSPEDLEENDFLISWERGKSSFRYSHYANEKEEALLVAASHLELLNSFESDGKEGKGNKYLVLTRPSGV